MTNHLHEWQYRREFNRLVCYCGNMLTNGGVPCDMEDGPCACGAWHSHGEEIEDQDTGLKIVGVIK